jgi:hypothetical protein
MSTHASPLHLLEHLAARRLAGSGCHEVPIRSSIGRDLLQARMHKAGVPLEIMVAGHGMSALYLATMHSVGGQAAVHV